jgi:hypothetical protein
VRTTVSASDLFLYGADYLSSTPAQLRATVRAWLGVTGKHRKSTRPAPRKPTAAPPPPMVADGGRGRALLASVADGIRTCAPTQLPPGFFWPTGASRSYAIAGHPAIALYATAGSGDSVLWMFTTWQDPPILSSPSTTVHRGSRAYDVYTAGGRIRQVAWHVGATRAWVTNTLRDTLTNAQMLALATSCR